MRQLNLLGMGSDNTVRNFQSFRLPSNKPPVWRRQQVSKFQPRRWLYICTTVLPKRSSDLHGAGYSPNFRHTFGLSQPRLTPDLLRRLTHYERANINQEFFRSLFSTWCRPHFACTLRIRKISRAQSCCS